MIHVTIPYRIDKNLGKAYNDAFENCPDGDWLCLMDWDVMLLTPNAISIMHDYVTLFPETGIFTCWTNRIHPGAKQQLWPDMYEVKNIDLHIHTAQNVLEWNRNKVTELNKHISGFLMLISKKTWNDFKFTENTKCLGVDNEYSDRILNAGKNILRMDALYVFHQYRMINGIKDKSHLL